MRARALVGEGQRIARRHALLREPARPHLGLRLQSDKLVMRCYRRKRWQEFLSFLKTISANWITLGFDSWGAPPLSFWIDGLGFKQPPREQPV